MTTANDPTMDANTTPTALPVESSNLPDPGSADTNLPADLPNTDSGPGPLVQPEHRPDSEWADGAQPKDAG
jgi:hypothetical protein